MDERERKSVAGKMVQVTIEKRKINYTGSQEAWNILQAQIMHDNGRKIRGRIGEYRNWKGVGIGRMKC